MDAVLKLAAQQFFNGTRAVNAVIFMNEHYEDLGGKGRLTFRSSTHFNLMARHPIDGLLPLLELQNRSDPVGDEELEFMLSSIREQSNFFLWAAQFWDGHEPVW